MRRRRLYFFIVLLALLSILLFFPEQKPSQTLHAYTRDTLWPQLPKGFVLGNPSGLGIDTQQNIIVFHRARQTWPAIGSMPDKKIPENTVLIIDRHTGKLLGSWGSNLFIMPHGLTVDKQNNIWVSDVALNQVFKFTHEGKLLMQVGEARVAGKDATHFDQPTDIVVNDDGSFYVSDGYGNSRIIKFSADGTFLFQWGKKGSNSGGFDIPHGITKDNTGKLYVADRENKRIQVFDSSGKFITAWTDKSFGNICGVAFDSIHGGLVAVDDKSVLGIKHLGSDILRFNPGGQLTDRFGRSGGYNGPATWLHDICIDNEGNIYVADILGNTIQKFAPMKR